MPDPIDPRQYALMNDLARRLDAVFNGTAKGRDRKWGFVLLSFEFGNMEGGRINYISNGEREDIVIALKELLARFEGRVVTPTAKQ